MLLPPLKLCVVNKVEIGMEGDVSAAAHSAEGNYTKLLAWDAPTQWQLSSASALL